MPRANREMQGIYRTKRGQFRIRLYHKYGRFLFDHYLVEGTTLTKAKKIRDTIIRILKKEGAHIELGKRNGSFVKKPTQRNTSGHQGVNLYKLPNGYLYWAAEIMTKGKKYRQFYPIKTHGWDNAFNAACIQRTLWEQAFADPDLCQLKSALGW